MGAAPHPWRQKQAATLFLPVPAEDWAQVKCGVKTEFRTVKRGGVHPSCPTPVVAYATFEFRPPEGKLMVLEESRFEPVFAISDDEEAVRREGFDSYDEFRRYWRKRRGGEFRPMERVYVWRLRAFDGDNDHDTFQMGRRLLQMVYGEWL